MATVDLERAENLYNSNVYSGNTNAWEDAASLYRAQAFFRALNDGGVLNGLDSILDVGCGSGGVISKLCPMISSAFPMMKIKFMGIDLSPHAINVANQLYPDAASKGAEFVNCTVEAVDSNQKFTVASLIHVLEHCPDMLEMLSICESKAKYLYINVPIEVNLFYTLRRNVLQGQYLRYGHLHFFDEGFFVCWLKQNGFKVLSTVYSSDFEIPKSGVGYKAVQYLRRIAGKLFGPGVATWMLGGYSLGVLVESR
jgi:SAM-dependent methyltransferase